MRGYMAALCGLAAMAAAPLVSAQDHLTDVDMRLRGYLERGMAAHEAAGYARERTIPDLETAIQLERPHLWSIYLLEGVNYRIYGACDDNCSDVDMEIYGADGRFIERDDERNDTPYVQVTPARTGRHYVRIWLYACSDERCRVAARVMSGGSPAPREETQQ